MKMSFYNKMAKVAGVATAGVWLMTTTSALAVPITFTGSDTTGANGTRSANVSFEIVGGNLQVTLANTAAQPTANYDATYSLLGVSFDFTGGTLTASSASLGSSTLIGGSMSAGTTIGDHWGFNGADSHGNFIAATGIGGIGHGAFGSNSKNVQGSDYGLIDWNSIGSANASVKSPQVDNSIIFTFTDPNLPVTLTASDFSKIVFWYGTSESEEHFCGTNNTPVPDGGATALLLGVALTGVGLIRRKLS